MGKSTVEEINRYRTIRTAKRKAASLCPHCGKPVSRFAYCLQFRLKQAEKSKQKRRAPEPLPATSIDGVPY